MAQDTLQEILGVERQLRDSLDLERTRASAWLEHARREIEDRRSGEVERLRTAAAASTDQGRRDAEARCATAVQQARNEALRISELRDDELVRLLRPHLARLLPDGAP